MGHVFARLPPGPHRAAVSHGHATSSTCRTACGLVSVGAAPWASHQHRTAAAASPVNTNRPPSGSGFHGRDRRAVRSRASSLCRVVMGYTPPPAPSPWATPVPRRLPHQPHLSATGPRPQRSHRMPRAGTESARNARKRRAGTMGPPGGLAVTRDNSSWAIAPRLRHLGVPSTNGRIKGRRSGPTVSTPPRKRPRPRGSPACSACPAAIRSRTCLRIAWGRWHAQQTSAAAVSFSPIIAPVPSASEHTRRRPWCNAPPGAPARGIRACRVSQPRAGVSSHTGGTVPRLAACRLCSAHIRPSVSCWVAPRRRSSPHALGNIMPAGSCPQRPPLAA